MRKKFERGDRVVMGEWHGEVTIVKDDMYKVIFDDGDGPNYDYYHEDELEIETEDKKEVKTWNDVTRSTKPINWRDVLARVVLTPERLNAHLANEIEKAKKEKE